MLEPTITPLLSALIGGLLTIVGGIAANYYLTSRTIRTEKRKEFRDFFEEISKCAYDIQICFARTLLNPHNIHDEAIKITELESRIVILQMLYAPSLEHDCITFCDNLKIMMGFLDEYCENKIDESSYRMELDNFISHAYKFRLILANIVQKKGYNFY